MSFSIMNDDVQIISKLGDEPNEDDGLTAAGLKAKFDEAAVLLKQAHNALVNALNAMTASENVGFDSEVIDGANVKAAIENLRAYLLGQMQDVSQGSVADGSVTAAKLGTGAVTTEKLADDAVTADKLADGVFAWEDLVEAQGGGYNFLEPASGRPQKDYTRNALHFRYCEKLNMMRVEGYVEFDITSTDTPRVFFTLPIPKNYNAGHIVFSANVHYNGFYDPPYVQARAESDLSNEMSVYILGLTENEVGDHIYLYVTGYYFCREGS